MGTPPVTTMRAALPILLFASFLLLSECEAYGVDRDTFHVDRRGYRDPDDPRNLFAAMYGGNYKRSDPDMPRLTPEMFQYLKTLVHKRGTGMLTTPETCSIPSTELCSVGARTLAAYEEELGADNLELESHFGRDSPGLLRLFLQRTWINTSHIPALVSPHLYRVFSGAGRIVYIDTFLII